MQTRGAQATSIALVVSPVLMGSAGPCPARKTSGAQTTTIVLVALPAVVESVRRRSTSVGACLIGLAGHALTTGRAHKEVHLCILSYLRLWHSVMF